MLKFETYSTALKLKMLRLEMGKSQEELAKELGISRSCLANYETGKRRPGRNILSKIAEICNVMPGVLLDEPLACDAALNEPEIDNTKKLKKLIQDRGTRLDISHLPAEGKVCMLTFYDYVVNRQRESEME